MALAEARAAWQRTANRCLVQEDAKRAPKLACCSSGAPSVKQVDTGTTTAASGQDIPATGSLPPNRSSSYSNLSPNSRWWLQLHLQPNYGYQKGLLDEQFTSVEGRTCELQECSNSSKDLAMSGDGSGLTDQNPLVDSPSVNKHCRNIATCKKGGFSVNEEKFGSFYYHDFQDHLKHKVKEDFEELSEGPVCCKVLRKADDFYFDSGLSWIGTEKSIPWWRTADAEELALLIEQKSQDLIDNCDLPRSQFSHFKKDMALSTCSVSHNEVSTSPLDKKPGSVSYKSFCSYVSSPSIVTAGEKLEKSSGVKLVSDQNKQLRDNATQVKMSVTEDGASKGKLLEALHHSQTRAREAENIAKQACIEKEHVLKLVLRQASQLFAYKQWLHLLQLENMYIQFKSSKRQLTSSFDFGHWKPLSDPKMKKPVNQRNVGKYALVLAVGLGLIGAGLLLGWTIGWMLPKNFT